MFAADAVKLARLWGLNRVSWLRGHCFWVGECGDWNERRFGDGGDGSRKGFCDGLRGVFALRMRAYDTLPLSASGDTRARPEAETPQDVSK